jgi:hypothetical protein
MIGSCFKRTPSTFPQAPAAVMALAMAGCIVLAAGCKSSDPYRCGGAASPAYPVVDSGGLAATSARALDEARRPHGFTSGYAADIPLEALPVWRTDMGSGGGHGGSGGGHGGGGHGGGGHGSDRVGSGFEKCPVR